LRSTTWEKRSKEEASLHLLVVCNFYKFLQLLNLSLFDEIAVEQEHQLENVQ
jgi:hypothetical protein